MTREELNKGRLMILLDAFGRCTEEEGREVLRHAIQHLTFPMWERQWPTAVAEAA